MLLFVIEADLDQRRDRPQLIRCRLVEEFHHGCVDVTAVGGDFLGTWPRQVAAPMAGVPRAGADIVGIKQEGVVGVKRLVVRAVLAEQELLEEPGGMGAMPFRRARVRHRLDQLILWRQRRGAPFGLAPDGEKRFHQTLREAGGIGKK